MSRNRTVALIFGLLIVVYIASAALTVVLVRDRLEDATDRDLRSALSGVVAAVETIQLDGTLQLDIDESERALIIIDGRDEVAFLPAGSRVSPLPRPDLTASMIVSRVGRPFETGSVDGDIDYRVLTTRLTDGRYMALAQPLEGLERVVTTLRWSLLLTLFAVVTVLGVVFWLILRASLRPYTDMIDTADAIAHGDLSRRAAPSAHVRPIEQLTGSLNAMLDRIQESFEAKESAERRLKQFLADASHELRTPLTTIRGYSELYLSRAATDPAAIDKQMTRINAEAARMGRLVDELLTIARLDDPRQLRHDRIDLGALVEAAVDDARAAGPNHVVDAHIDSSVVVEGDADSLRQVLANLLTNARVHTPPGTTITVTLGQDAKGAVLSVADDGPGIDEDTAAHVFDRFYRAAQARSSGAVGTGLGLSIVAANVEAHGGTIELVAAVAHGCVFTVRLPRVDVAPDPALGPEPDAAPT